MSLSRLLEGELCPRRVALRSANYAAIWDGSGYPPRFSLPAFLGEAVHAAVEDVAAGLRGKGCRTAQEPCAVDAIKAMGGFTRIAETAVERLLAEKALNPRFAAQRESSTQLVRNQLPELRRRIQSLMCQMKLAAASPAVRGGARKRGPLGVGAYSEVWLEVPQLGWAGRADQIVISSAGAEITEFKSGEPEPHHAFQLRVYALLWARDRVLNPAGRRPAALQLRYLNRSHSLPVPSEAELEALAGDLRARTSEVCSALGSRPPPARYHPEECRRCDVRQLCDDYWATLRSSAVSPVQDEWSDVEAVILRRHGDLSFDARIECADRVASGTKALIRFQHPREYSDGGRIRILGAFVSCDDETEGPTIIVRVGALTEVFRRI